MKKTLAVLLALLMALGMATFAFAAEGDLIYPKEPTLEITTEDEPFVTDAPASFYVHFAWMAGEAYTEDATEGLQDEEVRKVTIADVQLDVIDDAGTAYTVTEQGGGFVYLVEGDNAKANVIWLRVSVTDSEGKGWFLQEQLVRPEAPVVSTPDAVIKTAVEAAIKAKATTVYIDLASLATPGVVTAVDWQYITNTWFEGEWYPNYEYLNLSLQFYWAKSGTTFFIDADDLDYTWSKLVDFNETTGLVGYADKTEAEMLNVIRALTGSTKNPYVFGFSQSDSNKDRGTDVPKMTVSKVVPQQWINVYGHKSLELFIFGNTQVCETCGAEHETGHVVASTTLDAITQTQRIDYTTAELNRTLVLSATAAVAEEKPATEETDDGNPATGNPNTGANDVVAFAAVTAVISLLGFAAIVYKRVTSK